MKRFALFGFSAISVLGALGLIYEGIIAVIARYLPREIVQVEAASIGIIGGADGPTAVFVTRTPASLTEPVLFALLLAIGLVGLFLLKKNRKS